MKEEEGKMEIYSEQERKAKDESEGGGAVHEGEKSRGSQGTGGEGGRRQAGVREEISWADDEKKR